MNLLNTAPKPPPKPGIGIPTTDQTRAIRFADWLDGNMRYIFAWKQWAYWTDEGWQIDESGQEIKRRALDFADVIMEEAESPLQGPARSTAIAQAFRLQSNRNMESMITVLKAMKGVGARPTDFDAEPYLLGVQNGCVDLRTGKFRKAEKEDLILKRAGIAYDPKAKCPMWEEFLEQIIPDKEVRDFVRRAIGYSLTGMTTEQVLFFMYGKGNNGKSKFIELIERLLGDYAWRASARLFLAEKYEGNQENMMASLPEKRFVVGAEVAENARLAEHRIKDLTGGDKLSARKLFCEAFNFQPTHKLWFYGNHKPAIHGTDEGIWRRLKLIPFTVEIPKEKRELNIVERLWTEAAGILNWAIEGCLEWQKNGLQAPESVTNATKTYRDDEDLIGQFIDGECQMSGEVMVGSLSSAYEDWAKAQGYKFTASPRSINERVRLVPGVSRHQGNGKNKGVRFWKGISLRDPAAFKWLHLRNTESPKMPHDYGRVWLAWKSTAVVAPAVGNPTPLFFCSAMRITKASELIVILRFGGRDFRRATVSSVLTATWLTRCGAAAPTVPPHPPSRGHTG
jgi:putative DNA primase/helicase